MLVDLLVRGRLVGQVELIDLHVVSRFGKYLYVTLICADGTGYSGPIYGKSMSQFYKELTEDWNIELGTNMHKM